MDSTQWLPLRGEPGRRKGALHHRHVEFIRWPHLPEIVNASNKLAAAKNWPTIDLDALVKSLPKN